MSDDVLKAVKDFSSYVGNLMDRLKHSVKHGDNPEALAIYADLVRMRDFYKEKPDEIFHRTVEGDIIDKKVDELTQRKRNILIEMTAQAREILQKKGLLKVPL
jgi:hypothetical protein